MVLMAIKGLTKLATPFVNEVRRYPVENGALLEMSYAKTLRKTMESVSYVLRNDALISSDRKITKELKQAEGDTVCRDENWGDLLGPPISRPNSPPVVDAQGHLLPSEERKTHTDCTLDDYYLQH